MATYTIFAGVNGAGKTSIYKSIYYNDNKNEKRINTDEMVARLGSWKDNNLQIKCAREAIKLIKEYISEGISFNIENGYLMWKSNILPEWIKDIKLDFKQTI